LAIEWDAVVVEMSLLAGIIYGAVYLELWNYKRIETKKDRESISKIMRFLFDDLQRKLGFIAESVQNKDFKPFFTNMWDAVIMTNKHGLLEFEVFEKLQATYSWMKYYNTELESTKHRQQNDAELVELLGEVRQSIDDSLKVLGEPRKKS
jgi:hypothetical protein